MANEKRLIDANALNWGRCPTDGKLAKAWLDEAPTADAVEVVHGRWYWKPSGEKRCTLTCSVCESQDGTSESYNYCPNCGAKMDGGNEDA